MIYLKLFWEFCKIGAIGFGGGYAMLPLIEAAVVGSNGWLTSAEFLDLVTISQMTPGPILLNSATFVGSRTAGIAGAVCATLGSIFPSCIFSLLLAFLYFKFKNLATVSNMLKFLRPAVVGLIASAGAGILIIVIFNSGVVSLSSIDLFGAVLTALSLVALRRFKLNPMIIIAVCGAVGIAAHALSII